MAILASQLYINNKVDESGNIVLGAAKVAAPTESLTYSLSSDGLSYICTGITDNTLTDVVVPGYYNGLPVTDIGEGAFYNNSNIKSLFLSNNIKTIQKNGITNCGFLTDVTLPDTILDIGIYVFILLPSLTYNFINNGKYLGNYENPYLVLHVISDTSASHISINNRCKSIGYGAFFNCDNMTTLSLPSSVLYFGDSLPPGKTYSSLYYGGSLSEWCNIKFAESVLRGCNLYINNTLLKDLVVPNNVLRLNAECFAGWNGNSVVFNENLKEIGNGCFASCKNIKSIVFPNNIEYVGNAAFAYCDLLNNITLSNKMSTLKSEIFSYCPSITSITIPTNIVKFEDSIFAYSENLNTIIYEGTIAQWNAIDKHIFWNIHMGNYIVHCTDGDLPKQLAEGVIG